MAPPAENAQSNQVLYEMMMFERREAEASSMLINAMQSRLCQQQIQIDQLIRDNRLLTQANSRGANLVQMKHEAGIMFGQCTDRFAEICGTMRREIPEVTAFVPELERIILRADFAHHMLHGINFVDLTADEELGEDTELESDEDEVELQS
jgi:hypothetical protein